MIRVALPHHLRNLAQVGTEVELDVNGQPTVRAVLDALEDTYPVLRGTIRDHQTAERRDFIRLFGVLGGGLLVASVPDAGAQQESGGGGRGTASNDVAAWIHVDASGRITGFTGKTEIGQNIRTSLAQAIADELRVPLPAVTLTMADTDLVPFDQGTFGSQSTPRMAPVLARAAATAREMLIDRAAARSAARARADPDRGRG